MIKRFAIAAVLLIVVAGGLVGFNLFRDQAIEDFFANMPVPASSVSTVIAEPAPWTPSIEAIGTVFAARGVDLSVQTAGIVQSLSFSANQKVAAGEVLLQLDDAAERADLAAAETQVDLDRQRLDRARELNRRGVGTNADLDSAQAAAAASAAQVDRLNALLDQKKLLAPFQGTIGIPRVETGQYVQPGTVVATLQDLDTLRADFTVTEQRLPEISIGQPVRFGGESGTLPFTGRIIGIDPKIDPASRLVAVRAEITDAGNRLTPGQFVQVRVELPQEDGVIALPQTAVVTSLYGDYVYVVRPAETGADAAPAADAGETAAAPQLQVRQVFVQAGRRSGGLVEVREGISAGDEVVSAGQNRLNNGSPVTVNNPADATAANPQAEGQ